jgi:hypothetical protein
MGGAVVEETSCTSRLDRAKARWPGDHVGTTRHTRRRIIRMSLNVMRCHLKAVEL